MSLLAGTWLLPLMSAGWSLSTRLALCVVLSPFIVALEAIALLGLGATLGALSQGLLFVNLLPALLVVRELRRYRRPMRSFWRSGDTALALLVGTIPIVWLIASWWLIDDLRAFGWHNLIHTDIVYQLAQRGLRPEEPELAGLPLAYSWFGHAYWLVAGVLSDLPPTRIFPLQNLALLVSVMILVYGAARKLGVVPAFAILAAVLAVFGNNLGREIAEFSSISQDDLWALVGEERLSSPLVKFRSLNLMPASFGLYAGLLFLWSGQAAASRYTFAGFHGLLLTASALFYPVGFPAALCLSGATVWMQILWPQPAGEGRGAAVARAGLAAAGAGVGAASLGLWAGATQMGASGGVAALRPLDEMGQRVVQLAAAVGPFVVLAIPGLWRGLRARNAFVVALGLSAALMLGVYAVCEVRFVEYKYVLYARVGLGLLIGYGLDQHFARRAGVSSRGSIPASFFDRARAPWLVTSVLLLAFGALSFHRVSSDNVPPSLVHAPPLDESAFPISLAADSPHAGWTRAIRELTPLDTVVVAAGLPFHAGPFTGRSLYYPCETLPRVSAGYAISAQLNLVRMRGYDDSLFVQRGRVVDAIFSPTSQMPHRVLLRQLEQLGRPVAIHASGEDSEFLLWCRRHGHGRLLFEDGGSSVWFFERGGDAL